MSETTSGAVVSSRSKILDVEDVTLVGSVMTCVNEKLEQSSEKLDASQDLSLMTEGQDQLISGKLKSPNRKMGLFGNLV